MRREFQAICEAEAGHHWQELFEELWPEYQNWYLSEGAEKRPSLAECRAALRYHMPEIVPLYERLVELAGNDETAARFLTLYCPPSYSNACSQAVWNGNERMLVRNYDYSQLTFDAIVLRTRWDRRAVIGMSDCLIGLLDGINEDGLAVSLTWGGSSEVGTGFGIPIILRYVLETCTTAVEATRVLNRVPTHAAYNVTVVDAAGETATVSMSPNHRAVTQNVGHATNHQDVFPGANIPDSVYRQRAILNELGGKAKTVDDLIQAFLEPPLYSTEFDLGRGTLYTAAYHIESRTLELVWPGQKWVLPLEGFSGERKDVTYLAADAGISAASA